MQSADKQEIADTQVITKNQDTTEKETTAKRKVCHTSDKEDSTEPRELADEEMTQLDKAKWVFTSHVDNEQEIKTDQWHEEMDMPPSLGIEHLSVDDHLTINQRTSESENLHCTSENSKPN